MNWNRVVSALFAAAYIIAAFLESGAEAGFITVTFVGLPLGCIWFSGAMGGYVGPSPRGAITGATPGLIVCVAGWVLLLLPVVIGVAYAVFGSPR